MPHTFPPRSIKEFNRLWTTTKSFAGQLVEIFRKAAVSWWFPFAAGILAFVLAIPTIGGGLISDDLMHQAKCLGTKSLIDKGLLARDSSSLSRVMMDLFVWVPKGRSEAFAKNFLIWWEMPDNYLAFWRPLTSLSHWADYHLWPNSSALMHLHTIIWCCIAIAVVVLFYRRIIPWPLVAPAATILFLIDQSVYSTASCIACRSSLVTLTFGVLALIWYHDFAVSRRPPALVLSLMAFCVGLAAGEGTIAALAYMLSYALILDQRPFKQRLFPLAPFVVVTACYRLLYQHLGYGAYHSGLYIDPGREPLRLLTNALTQGPAVLLSLLAWPPLTKYLDFSPDLKLAWSIFAAITLLAMAAAAFRLIRRDRTLQFLLLGAGIAFPLACTTILVHERLLLFVGLGLFGAVAIIVSNGIGRVGTLHGHAGLPLRLLAAGLLLTNGVYPLYYHFRTALSASPLHSPPLPEPRADLSCFNSSDELIIVNTLELEFAIEPYIASLHNVPFPAETKLLAATPFDLTISRQDASSLIIDSGASALFSGWNLFNSPHKPCFARNPLFQILLMIGVGRSDQFPMREGDIVEWPGIQVVIDRCNTRPSRATIRFKNRLEDPHYKWIVWNWRSGRYEPFALPAIGQSVNLEGQLEFQDARYSVRK